MAKLKEKTAEKAKKLKKVNLDAGASAVKNPADLDVQEIAKYWEEEVTGLQNTEYRSEQEALNAITDKVIMRLKTPPQLAESTKKFLMTLMSTDPGLLEELRTLVKIQKA